jgi:hypothetical protein
MFHPEHVVEFYHLLGGGLKDAGWQREHMSKSPKDGAKSWSEQVASAAARQR